MARKVKIPNHIKKWRSKEEVKRKEELKSKRRFYFIVCEGEKTEPNYFKSLKDALPKGVLNVYDFRIVGTGNNTTSLVAHAIQLRQEWQSQTQRVIDKLWIVFDKDSFTLQSFNSAIQTCLANYPSVDAAWTNEAFELWYLLHFHFYNTGINRKQYQDLIEDNFKNKGLVDYEYKKNSTEMFDLLRDYGDREFAIRNATRLEQFYSNQHDYANQNPFTRVHHLVAELFDLERVIQEEIKNHV